MNNNNQALSNRHSEAGGRVVQIDQHRLASQHKNLVTVVECAQWSLAANAILQAMRMPLGHSAMSKNAHIPDNALARHLGHETVESFVTASLDDRGLAMDWPRWEGLVKGLIYQESYGLDGWKHEDVMSAAEEVTAELGRSAVDAAEFHNTRERIKERLAQASIQRLNEQVETQNSRIRDLLKGTQSLKRDIESSRQKILQMEGDREEMIARHNNSIADLQRRHETDMISAVESQRQETAQRYERAIGEERAAYAEMKRQLEERVEDLRQQLEQRGIEGDPALEAELRKEIDLWKSRTVKLRRAVRVYAGQKQRADALEAKTRELRQKGHLLRGRAKKAIVRRDRRIAFLSRKVDGLNARIGVLLMQRNFLAAALTLASAALVLLFLKLA